MSTATGITCPHCSVHLGTTTALDRNVKCAKCGERFYVDVFGAIEKAPKVKTPPKPDTTPVANAAAVGTYIPTGDNAEMLELLKRIERNTANTSTNVFMIGLIIVGLVGLTFLLAVLGSF